jgi:hypothetical protein
VHRRRPSGVPVRNGGIGDWPSARQLPVEKSLAGLIGTGTLVRHDGAWSVSGEVDLVLPGRSPRPSPVGWRTCRRRPARRCTPRRPRAAVRLAAARGSDRRVGSRGGRGAAAGDRDPTGGGGAAFLQRSPATVAPPFLGLRVLLLAVDGDAAAAGVEADRVRGGGATRHRIVASRLGYPDAVLLGRAGRPTRPRPGSPRRTPCPARSSPGTGSTPADRGRVGRRLGRAAGPAAGSRRELRRPRRATGGGLLPRAVAPSRRSGAAPGPHRYGPSGGTGESRGERARQDGLPPPGPTGWVSKDVDWVVPRRCERVVVPTRVTGTGDEYRQP